MINIFSKPKIDCPRDNQTGYLNVALSQSIWEKIFDFLILIIVSALKALLHSKL